MQPTILMVYLESSNKQMWRRLVTSEVEELAGQFQIDGQLFTNSILLKAWQSVSIDLLFGKEKCILVCNRFLRIRDLKIKIK